MMLTRVAYVLMVMISATTPLAIKLGGAVFPPVTGLVLRMVVAFVVGMAIFTLMGVRLNFVRNWKIYLAGSLGVFPNLIFVYMAVEYIPSGLVALMFGMSPFFTAILMKPILGQSGLQPRKIFAISMALGGLALIITEGQSLATDSVIGVSLMLASNILFAGSVLWVARLNKTLSVPAFEQTLGGMAFSLPGLIVSWLVIDGLAPIPFTTTAIISMLYLALVVSLLGFMSYFYILSRMPVETVALIPMISPVVAMMLGAAILDEIVTMTMATGAVVILIALGIHQELWKVFKKRKV